MPPRAECARWPRPLKPGGRIGLCSPAGPSSPESVARAVAALETRGYAVTVSDHACDRGDADYGAYLAGTDDARVSDLNRFLNDPGIDLILCARGGYGSARLLDRLDYEAARRDPKPLVGYSDITSLSLALVARAGVASFSGIMATAGHGFGEDTLDPFSAESFFQAVGGGDGPFPRLLQSPEDAAPWRVWREPPGGGGGAIVSGPVFPVCLSLLTSLLGAPYVPALDGAILVIEDVHEELYAVDRCLTQLRLAGVLNGLAAVLVGSFNGTTEAEDAALAEGVPRLARDLSPPRVAVASGIAYGHIPRRLTLPVGAVADVDLAAGTFAFRAASARFDKAARLR